VVVTPDIRPACCTALRALASRVVLADENLAVREAVEAYRHGELAGPSYLQAAVGARSHLTMSQTGS
jgi:hypothetical protein